MNKEQRSQAAKMLRALADEVERGEGIILSIRLDRPSVADRIDEDGKDRNDWHDHLFIEIGTRVNPWAD